MPDSPTDVVRAFCAAWPDGDLDVIMAFFTADAVYHNMPVEPVTGLDAIRATIESFTTGADRIEYRIHNIAAEGPVVLTERTDVFFLPGATIEAPVMGAFEVRDGKIAAWRDYFDMQQFFSQMPA